MKKYLLFVIFILCFDNVKANYFIKKDGKYILTDWGGISANDAAKKMCYDTNMFYCYYGNSKKNSDIIIVLFKNFSTDILCVATEKNIKELRQQDVDLFLADFDYSREQSIYDIESDLKEGIEKQNYSIDFLTNAMGIKYDKNSHDTMIVNDVLKYNLYFQNSSE